MHTIDNNYQTPDSAVFNTGEKFSFITCEANNIFKIIRNLNISKSRGVDVISVKMVKLCDGSLVKPISTIFQNSINFGVFPDSWK